MHRYLLRFNKLGNMRFLSHLDLYRLFRRALNRAGVKLAFSNGYNPHEKINIVQPLSLGFESEAEYFEVDTVEAYDPAKLMDGLNAILPEGVRFVSAGEIEYRSKNLTGYVTKSAYRAFCPLAGDAQPDAGVATVPGAGAGAVPSAGAAEIPDAEAFVSADEVVILRRDKKSGSYVERDVKDLIYRFGCEAAEGGISIDLLLSSSSNAIVNPMNLIEAFLRWSGTDYLKEEIRITRTAIYFSMNGEERDMASLLPASPNHLGSGEEACGTVFKEAE